MAISPLTHLAAARLSAVTAAAESVATSANLSWIAAHPAYGAALAAPIPEGATRVDIDGLAWWIPKSHRESGLEKRLRAGRLPWGDLAQLGTVGRGGIVLDVGANIGTTSITRIASGDAQTVYAFEPDPDNYRCLVENIRANGVSGMVLPVWSAVSDSCGTGYLSKAERMANHTVSSAPGPTTINVPTTTLDAFVDGAGVDGRAVSFVKIDVQGRETHVLRGATRLLSQPHIGCALEVSPKYLDALGSSLRELMAAIAALFAFAIDLAASADPFPTSALGERLAYVGRDRRFTNLLLYGSPA